MIAATAAGAVGAAGAAAATSAPERPDLTDADFELVRTIIRQDAAIALEDGKQYLVASRLAPVARGAGMASVAELCAHLRTRPRDPLREQVVDAMTTNETSFFRDIHPFESLREHVLPDLLRNRASERRLTVWCGASSSGQEPYSIAMVLKESFPQLDGWDVHIIATDISPTMLDRTRSGLYSQLEVNRGLPAPSLVRWFTRKGAKWEIDAALRDLVTVERLNLAERWPTMREVDVVFLRNVLIYFDVPTKRQILAQVREILRPDGYLILGGAETTVNLDQDFERAVLGRTIWYRPTR